MKSASLPARTKDHKKHKDIMDVYALIWHSGVPVKSLRQGVSRLVPGGGMEKMLSSIGRQDYERAADALGMGREEVEGVIKDFVLGGGGAKGGSGRVLPTNTSYYGLAAIAKALHLARADQKAVTLEEMSKRIGGGARAAKHGLAFSESIGVVEAPGKDRYSLTAAGAPYAMAHFAGDAGQIARRTLDVIRQSHLGELADTIKINKNTTREDLCERIKALGKGAGGRGGPDAAGATTVLRLFEDAGLLKGAGHAAGDKAAGGASRPRSTKPLPQSEQPAAGGNGGQVGPGTAAAASAGSEIGDLAVLTVRGVGQVQVNDPETLEVAEMYMDMLRKRLQRRGQGGAEGADAGQSPP